MATTVDVPIITVLINALVVPPTYKLPPIPTPPATTNEPVLVEVAGVVLVMLTLFGIVPPVNPDPAVILPVLTQVAVLPADICST